jgi:hypothetical protein
MERPMVFTEAEIANTVQKFEACAFRLEEFTHARHITVACWYLATLPYEAALARMRSGLQRFIQHHGKDGYHETITRFWMILLDQALRTAPEEWGLTARLAHVVAQYPDKNVLFRYYTRERVLSEEARKGWIEPDLQTLGSEISVR